jgi:hypothetical protein
MPELTIDDEFVIDEENNPMYMIDELPIPTQTIKSKTIERNEEICWFL